MKALRFFVPSVNVALVAVAASLFVASNVYLITSVHTAKREAQATCRSAVAILVRQKPVLDRTVPLADACRHLARMRGED